jgi:hypothetical protein
MTTETENPEGEAELFAAFSAAVRVDDELFGAVMRRVFHDLLRRLGYGDDEIRAAPDRHAVLREVIAALHRLYGRKPPSPEFMAALPQLLAAAQLEDENDKREGRKPWPP